MPFPSDRGFLQFFRRKRDEDMSRLPEIRRGPRTGESGFGPTMQTETGTHLSATEGANLRIYRQVAVEARRASAMKRGSESGFKIVNGYIESDEETRRIRALAIPVRRTYLESDPVCLKRVITVIGRSSRESIQEGLRGIERKYEPIRAELASASILNERRVVHADMFGTWLDAMVFPEIPEKVRPYETMLREFGKAVEGIGLFIAERWLDVIMSLDDVIAEFLGEPRAEELERYTATPTD